MSNFRLQTLSIVGATALAAIVASPVAAQEAESNNKASTSLKIDFLDAAYMPGPNQVYVSGHYGLIGKIEVTDSGAKVSRVANTPNADFTAMERVTDTEVLIGGSTGKLFRFDGESVTEVAQLSEYEEPILDIAANGQNVWVVGARGLISRSTDGGQNVEEVEIRDVTLPKTEFPGAQTADWYFGVSNLDSETIEFTAFKDGKPDGYVYVAHQYLLDGVTEDVSIKVDYEPAQGEMFIVMLHRDMNENRKFDFLRIGDGHVLDKAVFEGSTMIGHAWPAP